MKIFWCICLCLLSGVSYSQDVKKLLRYKFQLGISSGADNSQHSHYILSNLSLHLISGGTAAIQGFQISGFSNRTIFYTNGMQLSAISNVSGNRPIRNFDQPDFKVLQGLQISSLVNKVEGAGIGVQIASFNRVTHSFEGAQLGLFNVIERGGLGLQLGGIFNYAPKRNSLFQLGLFNYSFTAGLKYEKGFFLFRDHLQLGLINKTYKNHGLQIGLINLSKENEGVPIGLINTNCMEGRATFGGNELVNSYLTFAVGHPFLLNRLSVGYNYLYNKDVSWSLGYGLGFQLYKPQPSSLLFLSIYSDMIYLLKRGEKVQKGFWMNKTGVALTVDVWNKISPVRIGFTWNTAFTSFEDMNLDLPYLKRSKNGYSIWPGLELGFTL